MTTRTVYPEPRPAAGSGAETQLPAPGRLHPLTERVLGRLPGPAYAWAAAWALVPWLNAGANLVLGDRGTSAVWDQGRLLVVLNYAALSLGVAVSVWGTSRIARRLEELHEPTGRLLDCEPREAFRGLDGVAGPLAAAVATAVAFGAGAWLRDGWAAGLVRGATWLVIGTALWTFLWAYVSLMLGLDRLGRARLARDVTPVDPGLGLRPLGAVASMGLWMLLVWLVPVLLTALPDVAGVVVGIAVLAAGLAAFFLSLYRLHRRMVEVKRRELELARGLYAEAYRPVRDAPTLEALEQQRSLLGAADALEKRASAIHEWPIDDATVVRVVTITTSVIAMTIGRLILDPFGL